MNTAPLALLLSISTALLASRAAAATVTITDCNAAPVSIFNGKTVVHRAGDDVVLRCALVPRPGTDRVEILAGSILVDGPNGGSVRASGTSLTLRLQAERSVEIRDANVTATNHNGRAEILAVGGITITAASELAIGGQLAVECTGPACRIGISGTTIDAHELHVLADGTVTVGAPSAFSTHGPTDRLIIRSTNGDVLFASLLPPPSDEIPSQDGALGDVLHQRALAAARAVCQCVDPETHGPNTLLTGVEGNLLIQAVRGRIDLRGVRAHAGEDVDIDALTDVAMAGATIDNCGPKTGRFTVDAATCGVQGATLLDDEPETRPALSCTMSGVATTLGTCSSRP